MKRGKHSRKEDWDVVLKDVESTMLQQEFVSSVPTPLSISLLALGMEL